MNSFIIKVFGGLLLVHFSVLAQAEFNITYSGCVEQTKSVIIADKRSLFELLTSADLTECAFLYGAAWTEPHRVEQQQKLKESLLTDLNSLIQNADSVSALRYFKNIQEQVSIQPVTGRVVDMDLDLFHVEMLPLKNRLLTKNASFHFPKMPKTISMLGFQADSIAYNSNLSVNDIVNQNPICSECRPGWIWVVQPNTSVVRVKVGWWTNSEYYAAPGAWLIPEFSGMDVEEIAPKFYPRLAQWLALQVIP
jgi:hypothetical protein